MRDCRLASKQPVCAIKGPFLQDLSKQVSDLFIYNALVSGECRVTLVHLTRHAWLIWVVTKQPWQASAASIERFAYRGSAPRSTSGIDTVAMTDMAGP